MNERIEEFAKDCKILGEKEFAGKVVGFNYKKFAELIVGECCQEVERKYKYSNGTPVSFWEMSQDVQDLLKKHFGVKE